MKTMRLQIGKWGNSLAVRLPSALVQKAFWKEGDALEAELNPDGTVYLLHTHDFNKEAFLAELEKLHDTLPGTESVIDLLRREQRY